jgi:hypothetical protein
MMKPAFSARSSPMPKKNSGSCHAPTDKSFLLLFFKKEALPFGS